MDINTYLDFCSTTFFLVGLELVYLQLPNRSLCESGLKTLFSACRLKHVRVCVARFVASLRTVVHPALPVAWQQKKDFTDSTDFIN